MNLDKHFSHAVPRFSDSEINKALNEGLLEPSNSSVTVDHLKTGAVSLLDVLKGIFMKFEINFASFTGNFFADEGEEYELQENNLYLYANLCAAINILVPKINRDDFHINLLINPKWPQTKHFLEHVINYFRSVEKDNETWNKYKDQYQSSLVTLEAIMENIKKVTEDNCILAERLDGLDIEGKTAELNALEKQNQKLMETNDVENRKTSAKESFQAAVEEARKVHNQLDSLYAEKERLDMQVVSNPHTLIERIANVRASFQEKQSHYQKMKNVVTADQQKLQMLEGNAKVYSFYCNNIAEPYRKVKQDLTAEKHFYQEKKLYLDSALVNLNYEVNAVEAQKSRNEMLLNKITRLEERNRNKMISTIRRMEDLNAAKANAEKAAAGRHKKRERLLHELKALKEARNALKKSSEAQHESIKRKDIEIRTFFESSINELDEEITLVNE